MSSNKQRCILVVDDQEDVVETFQTYLSISGYDVIAANDGPAAIAAFEAYRPQLLITDFRMPVMNGVQLIVRLREVEPSLRAVVITGCPFDVGPLPPDVMVMAKPVSLPALLTFVAELTA